MPALISFNSKATLGNCRSSCNQIAFTQFHTHSAAERPVKQTTDHQALAISQLSRKIFQSRRVMPPKAPCRR